MEALENFWNGWANRRYDIVLIASGSATSWMADNLLENQGGLHNRITRRIYLEPFTLGKTEEYFKSQAKAAFTIIHPPPFVHIKVKGYLCHITIKNIYV